MIVLVSVTKFLIFFFILYGYTLYPCPIQLEQLAVSSDQMWITSKRKKWWEFTVSYRRDDYVTQLSIKHRAVKACTRTGDLTAPVAVDFILLSLLVWLIYFSSWVAATMHNAAEELVQRWSRYKHKDKKPHIEAFFKERNASGLLLRDLLNRQLNFIIDIFHIVFNSGLGITQLRPGWFYRQQQQQQQRYHRKRLKAT